MITTSYREFESTVSKFEIRYPDYEAKDVRIKLKREQKGE